MAISALVGGGGGENGGTPTRAISRAGIVLTEMSPLNVLSRQQEAELIARVQGGDAAAVEAVFRVYYPLLVKVAWARIRRRDLAEEVVEDVFLQILQRPERFTVRTSLEAYLVGAVRNTCLARLRAEYREQLRYERFAQEAPFGVTSRPGLDDEEGERAAVERAVQTALAELPERQQILVTMRWYRGVSYTEIAEVVESTPAAVKMQLSRILRGLRERVRQLLQDNDRA